MSLHITEHVADGVTILALSGRIVLGEESNALREKLKSLATGGATKIVLNMSVDRWRRRLPATRRMRDVALEYLDIYCRN